MTTNYFTLFGLPEHFPLDEVALQRAYISLQQKFHPDRLIKASDQERAHAIQLSMDVNDGYDTLKNPLSRAQHLLGIHGHKVNQDGQDAIRPEQSLLMEMMELRESLEACHDEVSAAEVVKDIQTAMHQSNARLEIEFEENAWDKAAQTTIRLRYLGKALEEAFIKQYHFKDQA